MLKYTLILGWLLTKYRATLSLRSPNKSILVGGKANHEQVLYGEGGPSGPSAEQTC